MAVAYGRDDALVDKVRLCHTNEGYTWSPEHEAILRELLGPQDEWLFSFVLSTLKDAQRPTMQVLHAPWSTFLFTVNHLIAGRALREADATFPQRSYRHARTL